jgi:ParB family chromosome partitioning protein
MLTSQILHQSKSVEWYTPKKYVDAARYVMGGIDLDPASCRKANEVVRAAVYYDAAMDGLRREWFGSVWLNPPYGKYGAESSQAVWMCKLIDEFLAARVREAVLLVNAVPGTRWFRKIWEYCAAGDASICFTDHRIRFVDLAGEVARQPTHSNVFVYFGVLDFSHDLFARVFDKFGAVIPHGAVWLR